MGGTHQMQDRKDTLSFALFILVRITPLSAKWKWMDCFNGQIHLNLRGWTSTLGTTKLEKPTFEKLQSSRYTPPPPSIIHGNQEQKTCYMKEIAFLIFNSIQTFHECLLCTQHCTRCWLYMDGQVWLWSLASCNLKASGENSFKYFNRRL